MRDNPHGTRRHTVRHRPVRAVASRRAMLAAIVAMAVARPQAVEGSAAPPFADGTWFADGTGWA